MMRFTNKFYNPSYTPGNDEYLFVGNSSGIHRITLNNTNPDMKKILDLADSWVSDMYFSNAATPNHRAYFVTGNTRVNDGAGNNEGTCCF
ncbi:MAG: hypothetical protein IPP29_11010 [Bacteroidetes bacterium]|nr:hypothetical protein [Bacteroidota bacterium]